MLRGLMCVGLLGSCRRGYSNIEFEGRTAEGIQERKEYFHCVRDGIREQDCEADAREDCISPQRVGDESWEVQAFTATFPQDETGY